MTRLTDTDGPPCDARSALLSSRAVTHRPRALLALLLLEACAARPAAPPAAPRIAPPTAPLATPLTAPTAATPPTTPRACVADEPTLPAAPLAPAFPAAPAEAVALCAREMTANLAWRRLHPRALHFGASLWCVPSAAGVWVTRIEDYQTSPASPEPMLQTRIGVRWVPLAGHALHTTVSEGLMDYDGHWVEVRPLAVTDWDGDGLPELVLAWVGRVAGRAPRSWVHTYAVHDGAIGPYGPAPDPLLSVADFDGDGRLDVEVESGFSVSTRCEGPVVDYPGPRRFARSLPDGTFTALDPAARAFVRRECAPDPAAPLLSRDDARSVVRIACARWNGAEPADVAARVTREYAGRNEVGDGTAPSNDNCMPLAALVEETATAPDYVLAPRCP